MIYGLDEYYSGLIEEAKSPEEIKKILDYQFVQGKGVPRHVFVEIFNIDPTKKKSYTRWVLSQYEQYHREICEALLDGRLEKMFKTFKERAGQGLDLTNIESFPKALEYIPDVDPILEKSGDQDAPENDFDVVYDSKEWTIAVPHTYEADKKLGRGCRWCTAGAFSDGPGYWKRYSSAGPLWINFDRRKKEIAPMDGKEYPYKRYQLLFEWMSGAGEFMDSGDHRVEPGDMEMPDEVIEFYGKQNPEYKDAIENGCGDPQERWDNYNQDRWDEAITVLNYAERKYLSLFPEQNEQMNLDVDYMLYDEDDASDPYFSYYFKRNDYLIFEDSGSGEGGYDTRFALLKDVDNKSIFFYCSETSRNGRNYCDFEAAEITNYKFLNNIFVGVSKYNDVFVAPMEDLCQRFYLESVKDAEFGNHDVNDVFINDEITNVLTNEEFANYAIEFILDNDEHALAIYGDNGLRVLVPHDTPKNGNAFTLTKGEDGTILIEGSKFSYKFDGTTFEADESNFSENGSFDVDGTMYYIVKLGKLGELCVYNQDKKALILPKRYGTIEHVQCMDDNVFLLCYSGEKSDSKKDVFDIRGNKYLFSGADNATFLFKDMHEPYIAVGKPGRCAIYQLSNGCKKIGEFSRILKEIKRMDELACVLTKDENACLNIFSCKLRKNMLPEGEYVKYAVFDSVSAQRPNENCVLLQRKDNNTVDLYNYVKGNMCMQDCRNTEITYRSVVLEGERFPDGLRIVCDAEGNKNLIDINGNMVLPAGFTTISRNESRCQDGEKFVMVTHVHTMWLIDTKLNLWPSKQGIDLEKIQYIGSDNYWLPRFRYKDCQVELNRTADGFRANVAPYSVRVTPEELPKIKEEVNAILFPDRAAVQESFNRMFRKITNPFKLN